MGQAGGSIGKLEIRGGEQGTKGGGNFYACVNRVEGGKET